MRHGKCDILGEREAKSFHYCGQKIERGEREIDDV